MFPRPQKWYPKNPEKYIGDVNNIITRSSWERRVLSHCDLNPRVIGYGSEEVIVPYRSPVDGQIHRYFVDIYVVIQDESGIISKYLVEIKPAAQRKPPKPPARITRRYLEECKTYAVNISKWKAAEEFCLKKGLTFLIVDENHSLLKTLDKSKNKFRG